jgi:drug/metabolite transporter (DMT)-like permease
MQSGAKYWFPSKRYGWGWGLPSTWQGWLVLAAFLGLVVAGVFFFPPGKMLSAYVVYIVVLSIALVGICWLKGEPPRWRWGDDEP